MRFMKAERKKSKVRLGLIGPSNSGKTYSSLLIARGIVGEKGRIALIDTEHHSGELYSDLTDYDTAQIAQPFSPDKYVDAIREAEDTGYDIVIVDSLSHAWAGTGGVLEMHEAATIASPSRDSWGAWRFVTPAHNKLVDSMIQSSIHVIATMRSKVAYESGINSRGKRAPVKIGLAPIQKEGLEYEFTIVLSLEPESHIASVSKDRTALFDGQHFTPTITTGETLAEWLNFGIDPKEASLNLLDEMAKEAMNAENRQALKDWWRKNSEAIQNLIPADKEKITTLCQDIAQELERK